MIELSESRTSPTDADSVAAPDWALVPFEVSCARCGHSLRGLGKPECPACGLEFDWSVAVPLDELKCPTCDYCLKGLTEPRCPECGRGFRWESTLAAARCRSESLFEYRWRDRPLYSLLATWAASLRPSRFWNRLNLHDRPRLGPLLAFVLLTVIAFATITPLVRAVHICLWLSAVRGVPLGWRRLASYVGWEYQSVFLCEEIALASIWVVTSLAALMIFHWSMRRYSVRRLQVVRAWAYAVPIFPLALQSTSLLVLPLGYLLVISGLGSWTIVDIWYLTGCASIVITGAVYSLHIAYKRFLRMRHSLAIAFVSQLVAGLGTLVIWTSLFGGDPSSTVGTIWLFSRLLWTR